MQKFFVLNGGRHLQQLWLCCLFSQELCLFWSCTEFSFVSAIGRLRHLHRAALNFWVLILRSFNFKRRTMKLTVCAALTVLLQAIQSTSGDNYTLIGRNALLPILVFYLIKKVSSPIKCLKTVMLEKCFASEKRSNLIWTRSVLCWQFWEWIEGSARAMNRAIRWPNTYDFTFTTRAYLWKL